MFIIIIMELEDNIKCLIDTTIKIIDEYGEDFINDNYINEYL